MIEFQINLIYMNNIFSVEALRPIRYLPETVDQSLKSLDMLLKGMKQMIDER